MRKFIGVICTILALLIAAVLILFGGEDKLVNIESHKHTAAEPIVENYVDPTCTAEGGYSESRYCTDPECGSPIETRRKVIPMLPHLYDGGICFVYADRDLTARTAVRDHHRCRPDARRLR